MTIILNGTAGITFPDGTIQTDGLSTPVPVADGGTGSTSTTYCSLTTNVTGTLPVANGGTGAATLTTNNVILGNGTSAVQVVAPGTTGNLLTSNGTTWTSAAPAAGGVTSFNGQTGAVVANTFDGINSYCTAVRVASGGQINPNDTVAGSLLRHLDSTGSFYTIGLTGTWRNLGGAQITTTTSASSSAVFVRIS